MNDTAAMAMPMPRTMFVVSGSPKKSVPTRMAVIGSKTPSTEAFVAPMLRVAIASEAVDTMVGNTANPVTHSQSRPVATHSMSGVPAITIFVMNTTAPTVRA